MTGAVKYRTIVADPPWDHGRTGVNFSDGGFHNTRVPYPTMDIDDIRRLPVKDWADDDAHLYLWTTTRWLSRSFSVAESWGFHVGTTLVWAKPMRGFGLGDAFQSNVEFILFGRRGHLRPKCRADSSWFQWPRGKHSAKPESFLDLVEQVSPGPYLELFARRQRLGWDTWGNECLEHVSVECATGGCT